MIRGCVTGLKLEFHCGGLRDYYICLAQIFKKRGAMVEDGMIHLVQ
jgi:hypothetical protein